MSAAMRFGPCGCPLLHVAFALLNEPAYPCRLRRMNMPIPKSAELAFDPDLIRRYEGNGPRYTSYPTAVHFHTGFDVGAYRKAAFMSNETATPLSLYIHVPFCTSPCFYCGCTRVITRSTTEGDRYVAALATEIALQAALFSRERRVEQIHFGGGTPTFLTLPQIETILQRIDKEFSLAPASERESSIEIDPRTVSAAAMSGLAKLGFNRISLGIQDFDPAVQAAVNRLQTVEQTRELVEAARRHGIEAINFDLIYGLPRQTSASFARTLDTVIELRPTRIAAYGYAHLPKMFKAQRRIDAAELPNAAERLDLLRLTIEKLADAGYYYVGMDHFALPEDPLAQALVEGKLHRNFQGYSSQPDCDLIGLGVSAIGKIGNSYAQNTKLLRDYYERIGRHQLAIVRGLTLTSGDRVRRDVIQALMCRGAVEFAAIEHDHCIDFREYFAAELERLGQLERDGLIEIADDAVRVSPRGRLLVRNVAMVFDAYLNPQAAPTYSKVI
jgi:oxygen-independent coproporphyrinogen-3 oxidase